MLVGKSGQRSERQMCVCIYKYIYIYTYIYTYIYAVVTGCTYYECIRDTYKQMDDKGWSSCLVVGRRSKKSSPYKITMLRKFPQGLGQC
jgi:hypothetical protein